MKSNNNFRLLLIIAAIAWFSCTGVAAAGDTDWKAGLARVKITPEMNVFMSGYASRDKPFTRVESDLFAKALVLEDAKGKQVVIVTSDLIGFPAQVAEPICERLEKKLGLDREQILLNSSHTHTGPMVRLDPMGLTKLPSGDAQRTIVYTQGLMDKVVDVVERAAKELKPARLSWGVGVVHFVMNRREFTLTGVRLGVNPKGLADRSVPVLRVDDEEGKLRAVLYGTAAHNTTLTGKHYDICGDYAGFSQENLEKQNLGIQAMFMLGCAGDANPYPRGTMEYSRQHGKTLSDEVARVLETKLQPVRGPLGLAFAQAKLPLQKLSRDQLEEMAKRRGGQSFAAKKMLEVLDRGEKLPEYFSCPLSVVQFGDDLTMVGLSGEVVVDYVRFLEDALGPNKLWIAAYCNDVFGYLPSARVLKEGGYETRGLYRSGIGYFAPEAQDVVVSTVRELAIKAGRKLPD